MVLTGETREMQERCTPAEQLSGLAYRSISYHQLVIAGGILLLRCRNGKEETMNTAIALTLIICCTIVALVTVQSATEVAKFKISERYTDGRIRDDLYSTEVTESED